MPYQSMSRSILRSRSALERAMQAADLSSKEIADKAGFRPQSFHVLRNGKSASTRTNIAESIETTLGVERGALFVHPTDDETPA